MSKFITKVSEAIGAKEYLKMRGNWQEIDIPQLQHLIEDKDFIKEMIRLYPNILLSKMATKHGINKQQEYLCCVTSEFIWIYESLFNRGIISEQLKNSLELFIGILPTQDIDTTNTSHKYNKIFTILQNLTTEEKSERLEEFLSIYTTNMIQDGVSKTITNIKLPQEVAYLTLESNPSYYHKVDENLAYSNPLKRPLESINFNDCCKMINIINTKLGLEEPYDLSGSEPVEKENTKGSYRCIRKTEWVNILYDGNKEPIANFGISNVEENVSWTSNNKRFDSQPEEGLLQPQNNIDFYGIVSSNWTVAVLDKE